MRLVKGESTKVECLYFHGIANELVAFLNFDDGVVGSHVVEDGEIVRFFVDMIDHIVCHFFCVDNLCMKFAIPRWNSTIKVHEVFGEGACFIKAGELNHPSSDNFILSDAKDRFFLQLFNCVDDSKGHADWQPRRYCYQDHIDKLQHNVNCVLVINI